MEQSVRVRKGLWKRRALGGGGHFSSESPPDGLTSVRSIFGVTHPQTSAVFDTLSSILRSSPNLAKSPFEMPDICLLVSLLCADARRCMLG